MSQPVTEQCFIKKNNNNKQTIKQWYTQNSGIHICTDTANPVVLPFLFKPLICYLTVTYSLFFNDNSAKALKMAVSITGT